MSEQVQGNQYNVWEDYYLLIQGVFYFAQGVAMGALFFLTAFLDYLSVGPFQRIVVQAVIWLPWYLKIVFGVLSDNFPLAGYGRRKPYIFMAGLFGVIGWVTLPLHSVFTPLLLVSGILASLGTSMSDATIDALAVDITPPKRRGTMQGVSWGSRGLGVGIAGVVVGVLADQNLWVQIFAVPGLIVSGATFLVLLFEERPLPPDFERVPMSTYTGVLKQRNVMICMVFQMLAGAGIAILSILQTFLEEGLGFTNTTIGIVFAIFSAGMFIGAVVFGLLGDRIAVRVTLPITALAYTVVILSILALDVTIPMIASVFFFAVGLVNGGYEATQMRISMDNSPVVAAGTMYNLYNSISNLGQVAIGAILIAMFVEAVGDYRIGWQLAWMFLLLSLVPGYFLVRKKNLETEGVSSTANTK
jgi:MFS family permease